MLSSPCSALRGGAEVCVNGDDPRKETARTVAHRLSGGSQDYGGNCRSKPFAFVITVEFVMLKRRVRNGSAT